MIEWKGWGQARTAGIKPIELSEAEDKNDMLRVGCLRQNRPTSSQLPVHPIGVSECPYLKGV
jgi:hypothetical protein